ncbi:hypothetical protein [Bradyrhizobium elkanii]|uniref:hypothetical protein n=1 Tax=Bradyrhizobium elkanii TaxID=29448 RepID=UPI0027299C80|nr:hypothetical protein [Bradyrhizobium elkanii]WLA80352.1 hypothetical protein QNJ99_33950 [Bradyrhizobium elkanii]
MEHLEPLKTFEQVFKELGGNAGLESLTGSKASTISMWRKAGGFPSYTYILLTEALRERGKTAPFVLWGMQKKGRKQKRRAA